MGNVAEKSLSFKDFYCSWLTSKQNAEIFWRILKSEQFAHLFPKKEMEEIKTEKELENIYNRILRKARGLTIDREKIEKAEELLSQANQRKNSVRQSKRTSFYFI